MTCCCSSCCVVHLHFLQSQGLIGSDGILPAQDYAEGVKKSFVAGESLWEKMKEFPSLFLLLPANDFWIHCLPFIGRSCASILPRRGALASSVSLSTTAIDHTSLSLSSIASPGCPPSCFLATLVLLTSSTDTDVYIRRDELNTGTHL